MSSIDVESQRSPSSARDNWVSIGVTLGFVAVFGLIVGLSIPEATETTKEIVDVCNDNDGAYCALKSFLPPALAYAKVMIDRAINPKGSFPGSLVAALSGTCPNYEYTWSRDQALVFTTIADAYDRDSEIANDETRAKFEGFLHDFAKHTHEIYRANDGDSFINNGVRQFWNFGDAKYEMDATMYKASWGSPQHDGPAGRALVLMRFANRMLELDNSEKTKTFVKDNLYNIEGTPSNKLKNPIGRDLDFLVDAWKLRDYEPWEERQGNHFYNRMIIRRAFLRGADFVTKWDSSDLAKQKAETYRAQAKAISDIVIEEHWNEGIQVFIPTVNPKTPRYDDIQTVFAVSHTYGEDDDFLTSIDPRIQANALFTFVTHSSMYAINQMGAMDDATKNGASLGLQMGPALGRYKGDVYNGGNDCNLPEEICPAPCLGQPWFLATHAAPELLYRMVVRYQNTKEIIITKVNESFFRYFGAGEFIPKTLPVTYKVDDKEFNYILLKLSYFANSFLYRTMFHIGKNDEPYRMDEQYNQDTGKQMSAGDLNWSYASLVTATDWMKKADFESIVSQTETDDKYVDVEVIVDRIPSEYTSVYLKSKAAIAPVMKSENAPCGGTPGVPLYFRETIGSLDKYSAIVRLPKNTKVDLEVLYQTDIKDCASIVESKVSATYETTDSNPFEPFVFHGCVADCEKEVTTSLEINAYNIPDDAVAVGIVGDSSALSQNPCEDKSVFTKTADGFWKATITVPTISFDYVIYYQTEAHREVGCGSVIKSPEGNNIFAYSRNVESPVIYVPFNEFHGSKGADEKPVNPVAPSTTDIKFIFTDVPLTTTELVIVGEIPYSGVPFWNPCGSGNIQLFKTAVDGTWEGTHKFYGEPESFNYKAFRFDPNLNDRCNAGWESGDNDVYDKTTDGLSAERPFRL